MRVQARTHARTRVCVEGKHILNERYSLPKVIKINEVWELSNLNRAKEFKIFCIMLHTTEILKERIIK